MGRPAVGDEPLPGLLPEPLEGEPPGEPGEDGGLPGEPDGIEPGIDGGCGMVGLLALGQPLNNRQADMVPRSPAR